MGALRKVIRRQCAIESRKICGSSNMFAILFKEKWREKRKHPATRNPGRATKKGYKHPLEEDTKWKKKKKKSKKKQ